MMRGKYNWAVAVREPDGAIYVEEHDLNSGKDKNGWMHWPLVRGCRALVESLMLGFKALEIAALHAFGDEEGEQKAAAEATFVEAEAELEGAAAVAAEEEKRGERAAARDGFDWKRDFGNPDEMVDGLGAQRTLEVVSEADAPARRQARGTALPPMRSSGTAEHGGLHGGGPRAGRGAVHRGARGHHEPHRGGVRRSHAGLEHRGRPSARGRVRVLHLAHRPDGGHQAHVHVPRRRAQGHPLLRARPAHDPRERPAASRACTCAAAPPSSSWSWSSPSSCTPSSR